MAKSIKNRVKKYQKNDIQEDVLKLMNKTLLPREIELIESFNKPKLPIIFIVGAQRSGTTVLMQLMTKYFKLTYPNNFIARYWDAPYIGARLYENLSNNIEETQIDLKSDLGYTKGLNGPHEFGYFWKKWFPWESWEEKKYKEIDYTILQKQLAAWESINESSLIFKNVIQLNSNIIKLKRLFPNAFFLFIKRDLIYNVQSTYQSRIKLHGNTEGWFGVKPSTYNSIIKLPVINQIAEQILSINTEIDTQLEMLNSESFLRINYEDLVKDKDAILNQIALKRKELSKNNIVDLKTYSLIDGNIKKTENIIFTEIQKYCK